MQWLVSFSFFRMQDGGDIWKIIVGLKITTQKIEKAIV